MPYSRKIQKNGTVILSLLDEITEEDNTAIVDKEIKKENPQLVLNLEKFEYINSSEIQKVIQWVLKARKREGDVKLCCLEDWMKDVFKVIRLSDWIEIFDTEEEAAAKFELGKM